MHENKLRELLKDQVFMGIYALRSVSQKIKSNGEPYLIAEISDSSGRLPAVYWGNDSIKIFDEIKNSSVVYIKGVINEYRDKTQVLIQEIKPTNQEEINEYELLPKGKQTKQELEYQLNILIEVIQDRWLNKLIKAIFSNKEIYELFFKIPAGKLWHGAYVGGLAEHTINVVKICRLVASFYGICRSELLITGALLHDIGKINELSLKGHFDYTHEGRLIGHIVLGNELVTREMNSIENFPISYAQEISHMIISHHGEAEKGSPIPPMTLEACILHHADMLEGQANAFTHVIERDIKTQNDFSEWVKPIERYLFIRNYRINTD